jgi:hypothetical protein
VLPDRQEALVVLERPEQLERQEHLEMQDSLVPQEQLEPREQLDHLVRQEPKALPEQQVQ